MARSIWSGAVTFGLVSVPVKLFGAITEKEVHFHLLHDADGGRIREKRVCEADGKEVPYEHIVKGYEVSRGEYVMLTREEVAALGAEASRTIDIEDFVDLDGIDPIYYDHTYYLVPERTGAKPYALLLAAMKKMNKVAIARLVLRSKQHLCAIRPLENALALSTMVWADEVVPASDLEGLPSASVKPRDKELAMAQQLIESLVAKFEPEKYEDNYRARVMAAIKKKAAGHEIVAPKDAPPAKVINLVDALKASLAARQNATATKRLTAAKPRTATKRPAAKKSAHLHRQRAAKKQSA